MSTKFSFFWITAVFLLVFSIAQAQSSGQGCEGGRFLGPVFSQTKVTTVQYGTNTNQANATISLMMDVYEPVGDTLSARPAIVLAHGGSYVLGNKTDLKTTCETLAKSGYVAVSISYRLFPFLTLGFPDSAKVLTTSIMSVADMKAAIRHLREDAATANVFRVNPDKILCGGYSAGAVTALHTAYMDSTDNVPTFIRDRVADNGGFAGNTGSASNRTYSHHVSGVLNVSGGIYRQSWVDASNVPIASIHGTADAVVAYETGLANGLLYLDGSARIHAQANQVGLPNFLHSVPGGDHYVINNPGNAADVVTFLNGAYQLFYPIICGVVRTNPELERSNTLNWAVRPQPNDGNFQLLSLSETPENAVNMQIFDLQGKLCFSQQPIQSGNMVRTSLVPGMYILRLSDEKSGKSTVQKLLISKN